VTFRLKSKSLASVPDWGERRSDAPTASPNQPFAAAATAQSGMGDASWYRNRFKSGDT